MLGCQPSTLTHRSMHHQKSSSDSPFHANTLKPGRPQSTFYARRGPRLHSVVETRGRKQQVLQPTRHALSHTLTSLCQCCSHFILGGVDVAGCPSALSPQSRQGLHQHLTGGGGLAELGQKEQQAHVDAHLFSLTAVCAVMWVQPTTLAPASGFSP